MANPCERQNTHGVFLYDSTIRVPPAAHQISANKIAGTEGLPRVSLVDIAPTLLSATKRPPPRDAASPLYCL